MWGTIGIFVVLLCLILLQPQRVCPDCGKLLPKFRRPKSAREMWKGGWTCPNCGCEVDRKGRKVKK